MYDFLLVFYSNFVQFLDIRLVSSDLEAPSWGSLKVTGTVLYRSATYDFLLTFHGNYMDLSCIVSEIIY